ncbi:MAG: hypothetical protein GX589_11245, partial [Deltaproteobacteria bacterium]|nr:hypothetical protein [Deltaproteobacteria bacterium]
KLLIDQGILTTRGQKLGFKETSGGFFFPTLLWAQLESLFWVGYQLMHTTAEFSGENGSQAAQVLRVFDYNVFVKKLQDEFSAAVALGLLERSESVSKASLTAAIENLRQRRILTISAQPSARTIVLRHDIKPELKLLRSIRHAIHGWLRTEPEYYEITS